MSFPYNISKETTLPTAYIGGRDDAIFEEEPPMYPTTMDVVAEAVFSPQEDEPLFLSKRLKIDSIPPLPATVTFDPNPSPLIKKKTKPPLSMEKGPSVKKAAKPRPIAQINTLSSERVPITHRTVPKDITSPGLIGTKSVLPGLSPLSLHVHPALSTQTIKKVSSIPRTAEPASPSSPQRPAHEKEPPLLQNFLIQNLNKSLKEQNALPPQARDASFDSTLLSCCQKKLLTKMKTSQKIGIVQGSLKRHLEAALTSKDLSIKLKVFNELETELLKAHQQNLPKE
ncbi:MAG: hypothetical protein FJZ63_04795 [Chlamydiae bacterium]|nr:hypothetical protein [Chlamydiota bacterium]